MANTYFSFKGFTVHQEDCAMKVCTDACIQGAYTAKQIGDEVKSILDIGTGTGLLTLMLAQQVKAAYTAVELDQAAATQAARNFAASPWAENIHLITGDARELPVSEKYDFIITNPPFYESDLKSPDQLRNQAMHTTTLNYAALLKVIEDHLHPQGKFSVLLPFQPFAVFRKAAEDAGFYLQKILQVKQSTQHDYFRAVGIFSKKETDTVVEEMAIRETRNAYSAAFTQLLKPYYLHL